jgi:hypothetical protein
MTCEMEEKYIQLGKESLFLENPNKVPQEKRK